jgi:ATP-dependent HslUV protease ATP-binding subunit HslU
MTKRKDNLTPSEIVEKLDRYIIGQENAKKSVAIALRNRYRRRNLPEELSDEIAPKNIIMIGPTGVGKTEIARRLSKLTAAPFIKVEATKYTEVGYVGRDIEAIIRELAERGVQLVKEEKTREMENAVKLIVDNRIIDLILENTGHNEIKDKDIFSYTRKDHLERLKSGFYDSFMIEIKTKSQQVPSFEILGGTGMEEMGINMKSILGQIIPPKLRKSRLKVAEARKILENEEADRIMDQDEIITEALRRVANEGIVFLDEIDKIVGTNSRSGPEVSREGVQRDLLPLVEGTSVMTKYGAVDTRHILFISAGAFSFTKPSDLIPELQGRFPIRVELDKLGLEDFSKILTKPKNAIITQYKELLKADLVDLEFCDAAIEKIAEFAVKVNDTHEDIGARRLHTLMEKLLEDILFEAPYPEKNKKIKIDSSFVEQRLLDLVKNEDMAKFIL